MLSIDLRGHGESISLNGRMISFQSFSLDDFNKMVLDVKAAKHFLVTQKHIGPNDIAVVGASIGANVGNCASITWAKLHGCNHFRLN